MNYRMVTISAIILFFMGAVFWTFLYGPATRTFVTPNRTVAVKSASEINNLWNSAGIHGRIAVTFTRHLHHQFSGSEFPEINYIDKAMRHGMVRTAYYVVPDRFWSEVVSENMRNQPFFATIKTSDTGFILLHDCGRIQVMPLSKYIPEHEQERALVVIEPGVWSPQEQFRINNYLKSGLLAADLVIIVGDEKNLY